MGQILTRGDAVTLWHTGAAAAGAVQAAPAASLGGWPSSTRAGGLGHRLTNPIPGVRVLYAAGGNGAGTGALTAAGADALTWTPPGGSPGAITALAAGATELLEGDAPGKYLVLSRDASAPDLSGAAAVTLLPLYNDAVGGADATAAGAGATYRCLALRAGPARYVTALKIWVTPAAAAAGVAIGLEVPAAQPDGPLTTIASETLAPGGIAFVAPTSAVHVAVLAVALLRPGHVLGLWIRRTSGSAASPRIENAIAWQFNAVG